MEDARGGQSGEIKFSRVIVRRINAKTKDMTAATEAASLTVKMPL
jgi:hypothetical protein